MPVKVLCPNPLCNASYSISAEDADRIGRCRECGTQFEMGPGSSWGAGRGEPILLGEEDRTRERELPGTPGSRFGRYKIIRKLGQGGMGSVYLAYDDRLDRPVALKMPHFDLGSGPEVVGRFLREARAAAAFHHPNFCPIHDVGEFDGKQFLAMAYVEGQTLASLIERDRTMPARQAAEMVRQLAKALAEAHHRGIVHRDLKPSNVMIDARGTLIIMDFGVARRTGTEDVEWTKSGALLGTPHYMSPEQVRGDKQATGPAIDIYALGVILYQLVAGRRPFEGPISLVLGLIAVQDPEPPSSYRPDLDRDLQAICLKAMAKKIEDRYPSMEALAQALESYLARVDAARRGDPRPSEESTPAPTPILDRPRSGSKLVPVLATAVVLLAGMVLAGFALVQNGVIQIGSNRELASANKQVAEVPASPAPVQAPETPPPSVAVVAASRPEPPVVKEDPTPPPAVVQPVPPTPAPTPTPVPTPPPAPDPKKLALEALSRASALLDAKDEAGAFETLDEVLKLDPDNANALDVRARIRISRNQYDDALVDLDRALAIDPKHADAHDNRGLVYFHKKRYDEAITDFRRAIQLDEDHPRAFINRGKVFQAKGDHERAIADFTEALDNLDDEKTPDNARRAQAHFLRGTSRFNQKELDKAVEDLKEAIKLDPKLADAYVNLGMADYAKGDFDQAIVNFRQAVRLEEDHARAYMNLGLAYQAKGDHARAIANFTQAIDNDPSRTEAYVERAESRLAQKDYARVLEDCDEAIRRDPRLADAYDLRGIAYYDRLEFDRAITSFIEATRLDSKHPNAFEGLGLSYMQNREYARAIVSFDEALRLDPNEIRSNAGLASILASCPEDGLRDGARAVALATRACELRNWKDAYALNALSQALAEQGDFARAIARLNEAIDLLPDEATRRSYRAFRDYYYEQGRPFRLPR